MIEKFIRHVFCLLVLITQLVFLSINANGAESIPLQVKITVEREQVAPGELVSHELTVVNPSMLAVVSNVRVMDMLPAGLKVKSGSILLNGVSGSDPDVSTDGQTLIFRIGTLQAEGAAVIRFATEVTNDSGAGRAVSQASAIGRGGVKSNIAEASVLISEARFPVKEDVSNTPQATAVPVDTAPMVQGEGVDPVAASLKDAAQRFDVRSDSGLTMLQVKKTVNHEKVAPGELVSHELTVVNPSMLAVVSNVRVMDMLPAGLKLKSGSIQVNGVSGPDPDLSTDGQTLVFRIGVLPAEGSAVISFVTEVAADTKPGMLLSQASAIGRSGVKSNIAEAALLVSEVPVPAVAPVSVPVSVKAALPDKPAVVAAVATAPLAVAVTVQAASEPAGSVAAPSPPELSAMPPVADKEPVSLPVTKDVPASDKLEVIPSIAESPQVAAPKVDVLNEPGSTMLQVRRTVDHEQVAPGELVSHEVTVTNPSGVATVSNVRVMDMLPAAFKFKNGSVQLNGVSSPDPAVSADGQTLVFRIGTLPAEGAAVVRFSTEVSVDTKPGAVLSQASAIGRGGVASNIAEAVVQVKETGRPVIAEQPVTPQVAVAEAVAMPIDIKDGQAAVESVVPPAQPDKSDKAEQPEPAVEEKNPPVDAEAEEVVQKLQSLAELVGAAEISILSDVDGRFVKNMAEAQTLENESASLVNDTNLSESIRIGRGFNRESRAAQASTEQAIAQTGQAFALLLPSVSVRANTGSETSDPSVLTDAAGNAVPDTHSRTDATLSVRQPLFDLPSFMDWRRRKIVEQARGENYRVSDGDAYISAVTAYLAIVSSRLQADMTREFETKLNDLLVYVEKRAKAGAASNSDMARVRARSQATRSSRLEQESAHAAAGIEFIRLTNLVPRKVRLPALNDIGASLLPESLDSAVKAAMKSNPEVAALNADIEAAEMDKLVAKGRYLPRVEAEYTSSYSLHAGGSTNAAGQKDQRLMMVMNWSLFSGGSDYKSHVERTARHKELQYRLDDQRRRVVQSLSANYATLETTRQRITSGYQELKSISTASEAMSKRMLSGNQSLLDMLDVYDRLYQVRSRLVSLHILEMSTAAQLVRLMRGTPEAVDETSNINTQVK